MADRYEPPHVHVQRDDNAAKLWLDPLEFAYIEGFRRQLAAQGFPRHEILDALIALRPRG
jgi:hypothetical protein